MGLAQSKGILMAPCQRYHNAFLTTLLHSPLTCLPLKISSGYFSSPISGEITGVFLPIHHTEHMVFILNPHPHLQMFKAHIIRGILYLTHIHEFCFQVRFLALKLGLLNIVFYNIVHSHVGKWEHDCLSFISKYPSLFTLEYPIGASLNIFESIKYRKQSITNPSNFVTYTNIQDF